MTHTTRQHLPLKQDELNDLRTALMSEQITTTQLRTMLHEQERVFRFLGHQLQQPIGCLAGYLDLFLDNPNEKYAQVLHGQVRELHQLVRSLLLHAKLSAGAIVLQREITELGRWARGVIEAYAIKMPRHQVLFAPSAGPDPLAQIDLLYAEEVLKMLLHNAQKYVPEGASVWVSVGEDAQGPFVQVTDNGPGIRPEDTAALFQEFQQGEIATRGVGLGLPLCRQLMTLHQGTITVTSEVDQGSQFTLRFPSLARLS